MVTGKMVGAGFSLRINFLNPRVSASNNQAHKNLRK